jgi:hypothetical protein
MTKRAISLVTLGVVRALPRRSPVIPALWPTSRVVGNSSGSSCSRSRTATAWATGSTTTHGSVRGWPSASLAPVWSTTPFH